MNHFDFIAALVSERLCFTSLNFLKLTKMLIRALALCSALFIKDSFVSGSTYEDYFFKTTFKGTKLTWMMMPDDNGLVVSALLHGLSPEINMTSEKVEFILWTRRNRRKPERLTLNENSKNPLPFKKFKASRKTIFLIHGFTDKVKPSSFFMTLVPAFLSRDDYNVIGVNWTSYSTIPWYGEAVKHSDFVGNLTAQAITAVRRLSKKHTSEIHVVAYNLGTLVAGAAASHITRKIERITGLDPPYILTNNLPNNRKLDKYDANLVEIVHTSGGYVGINEPVGHRDFYPNGGKWPQPGCEFDIADRCSPRRAFYYYAEAVTKPDSFTSIKCSDYKKYIRGECFGVQRIPLFVAVPGFRAEGKFYLRTNSRHPFSEDS